MKLKLIESTNSIKHQRLICNIGLFVPFKPNDDTAHCVKSVQMQSFLRFVQENTDQKKLRIWTLFTQWHQQVMLQLFHSEDFKTSS